MDASSKWVDQQCSTVDSVLKELNADKIPRLFVFNKIDLVDSPLVNDKLIQDYPDAILVSAFVKDNIIALKKKIAEKVIEYNNQKKRDEIVHHQSKELCCTENQDIV
jgi:50S ribosomal subunit-associated GTPase HflX